jgi:hypothetical protein
MLVELARLGRFYTPKGEEKHFSTSIECYLIMGFFGPFPYSTFLSLQQNVGALVSTLVENPPFCNYVFNYYSHKPSRKLHI